MILIDLAPKNVQEVKNFLRLATLYDKFCCKHDWFEIVSKHLETISNPLNNLRRKYVKFKLSRNCQVAFEETKK